MFVHCQRPSNALSDLSEPSVFLMSPRRAIENGANALAEGFLFGVAALLIIGETWRTSRNQSKRRDSVNDQLEDLQAKFQGLSEKMDSLSSDFDTRWFEEKQRYGGFQSHLIL